MKTLNTIFSSRQIGFSLVELMVAITISLILLAGVVQIYLSSKQTYRVQEALARVQENGRFAMDFLARDIRVAGYAGCAKQMGDTNLEDITYTVDQTPNDDVADLNAQKAQDFMNNAITGYEDGTGLADADAPDTLVAGTDAISITQASTQSTRILRMPETNSPIVVPAGIDIRVGDIVAITDCRETGIFAVSKVDASVDGELSIEHDLSMNSTKDLGHIYHNLAQFVVFEQLTYSIGLNPKDNPALFRASRQGTLELIEGVANMDIRYGVDTDPHGSTGYGTADQYVQADAIAAGDLIVSVRVSLLLQTTDTNVALGPQTYRFPADNDVVTTVDDGLLRRVFTSTIALRNRAP